MRILSTPARSLKEYRLLPRLTPSGGGLESVSLSTRLCRTEDGFVELGTPFISAAMQAVTGPEMAIAIAQLGGIGIVPVSQPIEAQCDAIARVKRYKAGFQTDLCTLSPEQSIAEVLERMAKTGYSTFPVTDTGVFHGRLLGVLTDKDFDARRDLHCLVVDRMRKDVQSGVEIEDLDAANRLMIEYGRGFLPIVSQEGTLLSVVFKRDRDKHLHHPKETVDAERRLRVGAAVSTHPEDRERAQALLELDVDVLLIDASDGHTDFQSEMLGFVKAEADVPVIAGNVVTADGFDFLAANGADAVKIGMGIGSGCTTQTVKATGRGQATALMEISSRRDEHHTRTGTYIPLIADGGITSPAEIAVALALGSDAVMLGNLLARHTESPGQLVRGPRGEIFKEYWMEGSLRAANARRYGQTRRTFFEEGIEGLVPHCGSIHEGLPKLELAVRSAVATAGCKEISALHRDAILERQSATSLRDGTVNNMEPSAV